MAVVRFSILQLNQLQKYNKIQIISISDYAPFDKDTFFPPD